MNEVVYDRIKYLVGNQEIIEKMSCLPAHGPFCESVIEFLTNVSGEIMRDVNARQYPDVITFAFWIRKASLMQMKLKYNFYDDKIHYGLGIAFHIAPSNVPVIFAYSLVAGLLTGNANIIRIPSKEFPQVDIICRAINKVLSVNREMNRYIALVRYKRDKSINDSLSKIADIRLIWGGDSTVEDMRRSSLPPRSKEITFADRYSLAVIDADAYLAIEDKDRVALDFYNDTYLSDQNACTSPRIVIWHGNDIATSKDLFWKTLHDIVQERYDLWDIKCVDKLKNADIILAKFDGCRLALSGDNYITRIEVDELKDTLTEYFENSGFFIEYVCDDAMKLREICNNRRCQTIGYIGEKNWLMPLIENGIKGVDRIVPVGHTMDFDLIWDGYNLVHEMTRVIDL